MGLTHPGMVAYGWVIPASEPVHNSISSFRSNSTNNFAVTVQSVLLSHAMITVILPDTAKVYPIFRKSSLFSIRVVSSLRLFTHVIPFNFSYKKINDCLSLNYEL